MGQIQPATVIKTEPDQPPPPAPAALPQGYQREAYALDEGDVVITFPGLLSGSSVVDLSDHLALLLRKLDRRARPEESDGQRIKNE